MSSRYERYIVHMYTLKIVAKLINFEQIIQVKKQLFEKSYNIKSFKI